MTSYLFYMYLGRKTIRNYKVTTTTTSIATALKSEYCLRVLRKGPPNHP